MGSKMGVEGEGMARSRDGLHGRALTASVSVPRVDGDGATHQTVVLVRGCHFDRRLWTMGSLHSHSVWAKKV